MTSTIYFLATISLTLFCNLGSKGVLRGIGTLAGNNKICQAHPRSAAYASVPGHARHSYFRDVKRADDLASEIDRFRRIKDLSRLKTGLSEFARVADLTSQPRASSVPPMNPTPARFALEIKLLKTTLGGSWLLLPDTTEKITRALKFASNSQYDKALCSLGPAMLYSDPGYQVEFFWYYRAWILAAKKDASGSVDAFFATLDNHTPFPSGQYFSIQVEAARHLSELPVKALRGSGKVIKDEKADPYCV